MDVEEIDVIRGSVNCRPLYSTDRETAGVVVKRPAGKFTVELVFDVPENVNVTLPAEKAYGSGPVG